MPNEPLDRLLALTSATAEVLTRFQIDYAVIGGLAVGFRTQPRNTRS